MRPGAGSLLADSFGLIQIPQKMGEIVIVPTDRHGTTHHSSFRSATKRLTVTGGRYEKVFGGPDSDGGQLVFAVPGSAQDDGQQGQNGTNESDGG